jgi:hypothetical protein
VSILAANKEIVVVRIVTVVRSKRIGATYCRSGVEKCELAELVALSDLR